MREIKFRAYDKKTKKMRQVINIVFNTGFGIETNDNNIKLIWVKGKDIIEDKDIQLKRENNFELMQYTGLKDKNGVEIYEDDIVYVISEDENGFILWVEETARYIVQFKEWCADFDNYYGKDLEVIGNMYENKDLLKGE